MSRLVSRSFGCIARFPSAFSLNLVAIRVPDFARSQAMRILACVLLLCLAGPTLGEEKRSFDFRGAQFNSDYFRYGGPSPDKYMKPDAEGLRLRYTGADVPPTNNPSCVEWRFHV